MEIIWPEPRIKAEPVHQAAQDVLQVSSEHLEGQRSHHRSGPRPRGDPPPPQRVFSLCPAEHPLQPSAFCLSLCASEKSLAPPSLPPDSRGTTASSGGRFIAVRDGAGHSIPQHPALPLGHRGLPKPGKSLGLFHLPPWVRGSPEPGGSAPPRSSTSSSNQRGCQKTAA